MKKIQMLQIKGKRNQQKIKNIAHDFPNKFLRILNKIIGNKCNNKENNPWRLIK